MVEVVDDDGEVTVAVTKEGVPSSNRGTACDGAALPRVGGVDLSAQRTQDAYDLYLEAHEHEARRDFDEGGHEYASFEDYLADDPPMSWPDFFAEWCREQEEQARELGWRSA